MENTLNIQEIQRIAGLKTNNPNISEQEAVRVLNSIFSHYTSANIDPLVLETSYCKPVKEEIYPENSDSILNNLLQTLGFNKTDYIPSIKNVPPVEPTAEEIQFFATDFLKEDLNKALDLFNAQKTNQGSISKFYSSIKDLFRTDLSASQVSRVLAEQALDVELLQLAANNQLSEKDYLQAKLDFAVKLFGNNSEKAEQLRKGLASLEPETLNTFISNVLALNNYEYKQQIPQVKENILKKVQFDEQIQNRPKFLDRLNFNIQIKNPNSIESLIQSQNAFRLMPFEEVFELEKGVAYNPENIKNFTEKQTYLSIVQSADYKIRQVKEILYNATKSVEDMNSYGGGFVDATGKVVNNLERNILCVLKDLYSDDEKIEQVLQRSGAELIHGKIVFKDSTSYRLVLLSKNIQKTLEKNFKKLIKGKTIESIQAEYQDSYKLAYGEKNSTQLAKAFIRSQQEGVEYIKGGIEAVGMVVMIAGQLIPVGGQVASAMIYGGLTTATFGGVATQLVENTTKAGGITAADKKAMAKEIVESVALVAAGGAVGKVSSMAFARMVMANCDRTLSFVTKYGIDVVLGVVSDMAITGDYNITQETIANVIPIIVGVAKTKGSMVRYVETEVYNSVGSVTQDYFARFPEDYDKIMKIMIENKTHLGYLANLNDDYWRAIIQSSQTPPTGAYKEAMMEYKKTSKYINKTLSKMIPSTENIEIYIKNITDYINTTNLEKPIIAFRDDDSFKLKSVILPDGRNLGNTLEELYNSKCEKDIKEFIEYLKSIKQTYAYTNERFMSTTFVKENRFDKSKSIRFEFNVPEGTKGTFIETYNDQTKKGTEMEYLLQRDTEIVVTDIQWSKDFDCWYIKADIKQKGL